VSRRHQLCPVQNRAFPKLRCELRGHDVTPFGAAHPDSTHQPQLASTGQLLIVALPTATRRSLTASRTFSSSRYALSSPPHLPSPIPADPKLLTTRSAT
jgi:hypothetical protein